MKAFIQNSVRNWKTTSLGLAMIGGSVIHLVFAIKRGHATEGVCTASLSAMLTGLGLIVAGDAGAAQPPQVTVTSNTPHQQPVATTVKAS